MRQVAHSTRTKVITADIAAVRGGNFPLIGEIKAMPQASRLGVEILRGKVQRVVEDGRVVEFGLFADHDEIHLFRVGPGGLLEPVANLATPPILEHYDPNTARRRIFDAYMNALIRSWLTDFADARWWRNPPARADLAAIGLADGLLGATIEPGWKIRIR